MALPIVLPKSSSVVINLLIELMNVPDIETAPPTIRFKSSLVNIIYDTSMVLSSHQLFLQLK